GVPLTGRSDVAGRDDALEPHARRLEQHVDLLHRQCPRHVVEEVAHVRVSMIARCPGHFASSAARSASSKSAKSKPGATVPPISAYAPPSTTRAPYHTPAGTMTCGSPSPPSRTWRARPGSSSNHSSTASPAQWCQPSSDLMRWNAERSPA